MLLEEVLELGKYALGRKDVGEGYCPAFDVDKLLSSLLRVKGKRGTSVFVFFWCTLAGTIFVIFWSRAIYVLGTEECKAKSRQKGKENQGHLSPISSPRATEAKCV